MIGYLRWALARTFARLLNFVDEPLADLSVDDD